MVEPLASSPLPPTTNDAEEASEHLLRHGVCRLTGALSSTELDTLREAVGAAAAEDAAKEQSYTYSLGANRRIWSLFNRGECFLDLAENPAGLRVIRALLGADALLSNLSANVTGPGGSAMVPHWDQDWADRPWPRAFVAHIIWMIDEFTVENGATLVYPGSHLLDGPPRGDAMVPATGPAGTALIIDGRTWHGTGSNTTADRERIGILAYYCRPYIRQQENMALSLSNTVRDAMNANRRKLYGLDFYEYLNMVNGPPRNLPRY
jgi:ectoine hydroxylase-related dioxygenase (phytanoyl-CoA dioxygenase family)